MPQVPNNRINPRVGALSQQVIRDWKENAIEIIFMENSVALEKELLEIHN
jgi:hypothetical protein